MAHPCPPYLEHEDTHVGNSQVNSGPLSVRSCVKSNAIHFQLSGNLKHLEIRLGRRLAPIIKDGMITALKTISVLKKPKHITKLIRKTKHNRTIQCRKFVSEWTAHCKFIYPQKCSILHTQTKETVCFLLSHNPFPDGQNVLFLFTRCSASYFVLNTDTVTCKCYTQRQILNAGNTKDNISISFNPFQYINKKKFS